MREDPLLRKLGRLAKEDSESAQADLDERWDRLAAGTLTPAEEAELRALAAGSPRAREAYEAFRPLGEDFEARLVDRLASEMRADAEPEVPRAHGWPFRLSRGLGWGTAAVAAAAAALFLLVRGPGPATGPLPGYVAELNGGVQTFRGEEGPSTGPRTFAPGDRFQVVLRPDTETSGKGLEARCFLLRDGDLRRLEARIQVDPGGAVKLEGSIGRGLEPGDWTLWSVVGRRGELPDPADPRFPVARGEIRERDWVAVPTEIRIHSRSP